MSKTMLEDRLNISKAKFFLYVALLDGRVPKRKKRRIKFLTYFAVL